MYPDMGPLWWLQSNSAQGSIMIDVYLSQNSPEINELDTDKNILKILEHNFENQKS